MGEGARVVRSEGLNAEINASEAEMKRSNVEIKASKVDLFSSRIPELTAAEAIECDRIRRGLEDPHFKVIEALGCRRLLDYLPGDLKNYGVRDFCHVSFYAKPTESNSNFSDKEAKVLIFAELLDAGYLQFMLHYWWVSKPDHPPADITHGCGFCPHDENYPHPIATTADQYHTAQSSYISPDHARQQELVESFRKQVITCSKGPKPKRCQTIFEFKEYDPSCFSPELSDCQYAECALKLINFKEDAEFVLVETLGSRRQELLLLPDGFTHWCHVFFTAKEKNADDGVPPVTFFVELHDPAVKEFRLSAYHKFDDGDRRTEGCGFCPGSEKFPHPPTYSYRAGTFPRACVPD